MTTTAGSVRYTRSPAPEMKPMLPHRSMNAVLLLLGLLLGVAGLGIGQEATVGDETLSLSFAPDATVSRAILDGKALDLAGPGGFSCMEVKRDPTVQNAVIYRNGFGAEAKPWAPVAYANPGKAVAVAPVEEEGNTFLRVGATARFGHGFGPAKPIALKPGTLCDISWRGRVPDAQSNFIIYIRVFGKQGKDITSQSPAPKSWAYSIYSFTHYRNVIAPAKENAWEKLTLHYRVPEGAHAILPAFCLWRGTHADVDDVTVTQLGGTLRRRVVFDRRTLRRTPNGLQLDLASSTDALALRADLRTEGKSIRVETALRDTSVPPRPRAIVLRFDLPLALTGWEWHRNWREDKLVVADSTYTNTAAISGHPVSFYPFTAVSREGAGIALGTPFAAPAIEHRQVSAKGIATESALGMLPRGDATHPTTVSFLLFPFRGSWGFRSATKSYYGMFAEGFTPRTKKEGLWVFPVPPSQLPPHPEDFGFAFWEGWSDHAREQERASELGIAIHPYTEAWGMRQGFPKAVTAADLPPVPDRLAQLRQWAATETPGKKWFGAPRHLAAQAALNSLPTLPDGSHPFTVDKYSVWSHWWRTNPDPNLPQPNRATLCWDYRIATRLARADGIYLDSLSYGFAVNYLNVSPAQLAVMTDPLTFDPHSGQPGADGIQHQVAFVRWLAKRLHPKGKVLQGNLFGIAHRFHAPLIDIFGREVGSFGRTRQMDTIQSDDACCLSRFYANRRPVCNLLQEGNFHSPVPEVTHEEMKRYIDHQIFYGFYPGVATIGGEDKPGYAGWKRYFRGDAQCGRDRGLFKEAIPLIRRLNKAGWQPETGARCNDQTTLVERYGGPPDSEILLTIRNPSPAPVTTTLWLEPDLLGKPIAALVPARPGSRIVPLAKPEAHLVTLAPWQTAVFRLR